MGKENNKNEVAKTCFVIMPISDHPNYPKGHFTNIYEQIFKPAIEEAGFIPKRVDEDKISSDIMTKILEGVTTSEMAICDLSSRNPNVMYELGLRHAYGKPVVLICDNKTERIFDVAGINTVTYKSERLYEDVIAAREDIKEAIISTERNPHSILKIAEVQAAEPHSNDKMDDNDYLKIMLMSIMNEIDSIKQTNARVAVTNEKDNAYLYLEKEIYVLMNIVIGSKELSDRQLKEYYDRVKRLEMQVDAIDDIPKNLRMAYKQNLILLEQEIRKRRRIQKED